MLIKKAIPALLIIFSVFFISACKDEGKSSDDALSMLDTQVYYLEQLALPEGAQLHVYLEDVSKMDVASELISTSTRSIKSKPPYLLQVAFPTNSIEVNKRYNLRASITLEGELLFISTTQINPFAVGVASPVNIKVEQVAR